MPNAEFRLAREDDWSLGSGRLDRGVTVILRTRDRPVFLRRACQSIAAQRFDDITLCLINDGGDREAVEAIARSTLPTSLDVEFIHHATALGQAMALNVGLGRVRRQFFAFHDDDDSWSPSFLERMVAFLQQPENNRYIGAICYTSQVTEVLEHGEPQPVHERLHIAYPPVLTLFDMLYPDLHPPPISQLMRHAALEIGGTMNCALSVSYDFEWTIRVLRRADIVTLPETLAFYHLRRESEGIGGSTQNSVYAFHAEAQRTRALLFNQLLREDFASGKVGLGFASSLVYRLHRLERRIDAGLSDEIIAYLAQRARRHARARRFMRRLESPFRFLRAKLLGNRKK
jgi:glycosyltransferase involved in cell wall biosynthesis